MSKDSIELIIREYIPQIIHLSLATTKDNKPWVCEVHFAYDDELNLYFMSGLDSRHSQEILNNPYVAGNIVTQHHKNQKVRCVDFEGKVEIIRDIERDDAGFKAYTARFDKDESFLEKIKKDENAGLFKITVSDYYLFDSYGADRGKQHLPWQKKESA